jgi:hypothetical protein
MMRLDVVEKTFPRLQEAIPLGLLRSSVDVRADGTCVWTEPGMAEFAAREGLSAYVGPGAVTYQWRIDRRGNLVVSTDPPTVFSLTVDGRRLLEPKEELVYEREAKPAAGG